MRLSKYLNFFYILLRYYPDHRILKQVVIKDRLKFYKKYTKIFLKHKKRIIKILLKKYDY